MRWIEALVAAVLTFQLTGSAFIVALVLTMRALPMALGGALAGALAESFDRRRMVVAILACGSASALLVVAAGLADRLAVWQLGLNGLAAGLVYATDLATRRRMSIESVPRAQIGRAVAIETVSAHATRCLGPIIGGLIFERLGFIACFALSALGQVAAMALVLSVPNAQVPRPVRLSGLGREIREALGICLRIPALSIVLGVTIVANVFAFSYNGVLPALGQVLFGAGPVEIGLLAGAEPLGAMLAGLAITWAGRAPGGPWSMSGGAAGFMVLLLGVLAAPYLWLALLLLALGGVGTAVFAMQQVALVMQHAPAEARSRVMGLTTTCIGLGPAGVLAAGWLADRVGPVAAVAAMALAGLALLGLLRAVVASPETPRG